jgi:hypothetical protein
MPNPPRIARPASEEHAPYYLTYVRLVPGEDAWPALSTQQADTLVLLGRLDERQALHRYAPGKWSVKEVVGHLADAERVFAYRALRFARADETPLPGFDENRYVPAGRFDARPLDDVLGEFRAVRAATLALFASFDQAALLRRGVANQNPMSVRALAWVIAGHERHHAGLLRERYAPGW